MEVKVFKDSFGNPYPVLLTEDHGSHIVCWTLIEGRQIPIILPQSAYDRLQIMTVTVN